MKKAKDFRQFNKIERKYTKRHLYAYNGEFLNIFVYYDIISEEQAKEALTHSKWCRGNLRLILEDYLKNKDKIVYNHQNVFLFKGIQITNEDIYYILEDCKGNIQYESCVGKIEYLDYSIFDELDSAEKTDDKGFEQIKDSLRVFKDKLMK